MNTEHLRKSLKTLWLSYYRTHRDWLVKLGVWVNCEGQRRPSSSFILATLATLEPDLLELLPLIVDLSSNPDRIVIALGLNFNPDDALEELEAAHTPAEPLRLLPSRTETVHFSPAAQTAIEPRSPIAQSSVAQPPIAQPDDACEGVGPNPNLRYERTN